MDALGTKEDFFNAIVQERAWEFGGEKHRRYDLARWNLYGKHYIICISIGLNWVK